MPTTTISVVAGLVTASALNVLSLNQPLEVNIDNNKQYD